MQFMKRRRQEPSQALQAAGAKGESYKIDFDMMIKGHIATRKRSKVRQYCVTVGGASRLVTSGDVVDRTTYDALLAAGAIKAVPEAGKAETVGDA
jgi:hypothetical protein